MTVFAPELCHLDAPACRASVRPAPMSQNDRQINDFGLDPLAFIVAKVLSVPLRELYALLWRAGLVEIVTDRWEEGSR